jgi:hypothetical protein
MNLRTVRSKIAKHGFYVGVMATAVVVGLMQLYIKSASPVYEQIPMREKAVEAFMGMNQLITTLSTTLLGAMGFLLFSGRTANYWSRALWAAIAGAISVGLSLFYGYVAYLQVISMLEDDNFNAYSPQLQRAQYAHFYLFLIGVVLFALFVYQNMQKRMGGAT